MTASEGLSALQPMADGLMSRYMGLCIQDMLSMFFALIDIKQLDKNPLGLFTQAQIAAGK